MDIKKKRLSSKMSNRRKIAAAREAHICLRCKAPLPEGETRLECAKCRKRTRDYQRERYEYRRLSGACVWCGRIVEEGFSTCAACRKMAREKDHVKRKRHSVYIATAQGEDPITGPVSEIAGILGCCRKSIYRKMQGKTIRKLEAWTFRKMTEEEARAYYDALEEG